MLRWLTKRFSQDLAIDLGTSSTRIGRPADGICLDEPSVVAVGRDQNSGTTAVIGGSAVGQLAHQMLGRTPQGIRAVRPISHGVISDFELTETMLRVFLQKATGQKFGIRPRVVIAIPGCITAVEKRAVLNSAERAGAGQIWMIEKGRAAAIGCGLPISEPVASMVCDIGGGTTEVAVMSLGDIVAAESLRTAGDVMDEAIVRYLRRNYSLKIGIHSAELLKLGIGSADILDHEQNQEVSGLDTASGIPRKAVITSEEIREALQPPLLEIVDGIRRTIEQCQPELIADLADTGMVLTGGGAVLRGLDRFLRHQLGIPVRVADQPRTTVTKGALICLDHLEQWQDRLERA